MKKTFFRGIAMMLVFIMVFGSINFNSIINVNAATKNKLTLSEKSISTYVGGKTSLKVKSVMPKNLSKKVIWTSANKKIATVSKSGVVHGKKPGSTKITATLVANKKVKATCEVKVYNATKKLSLTSDKDVSLKVGQTATCIAKVTSPKKGAQPVSWTSQNEKVATVNSKGMITAMGPGTTTIIGKSGNKSVKVAVVVEEDKVMPSTTQATSAPAPTNAPTNAPEPTATPEPEPTATPEPEKAVFTVDDCTDDSIVTAEEMITISGTLKSEVEITKVACTYNVFEQDAKTIDVTGVSSWEVKDIPMAIGFNTVTLSAYNGEEVVGQKEIAVTRRSTQITLSENAVLVTADEDGIEKIGTIYDKIVDVQMLEDETGNTTEIRIMIEKDNPMYQSIVSGEWQEGAPYYIEPNQYFYGGLNIVLDAVDDDFSGFVLEGVDTSNCKVIHCHESSLSDLIEGETCFNATGINEEDPIAYVDMVQFQPFDDELEADLTPETLAGNVSVGSKFGDFKIGFETDGPKGDSFNIDTTKFASSHTIGFNGNVVIYDEDGNRGTTDDQIVLSGNLSFENIDGKLGYIDAEGIGLFDQLIGYLEYTLNRNVKISYQQSGDLTELVKQINKKNGFEAQTPKMKWLKGVGFDDIIMLGVIGVKLSVAEPHITVVQKGDIKKIDGPIIALYVGIDLEGNIQVHTSVEYKDSAYQKKGINIQRIGSKGEYGSCAENKSPTLSMEDWDYQIDIYNVNGFSKEEPTKKPNQEVLLQAEGSGSIYSGISGGILVSIFGIVPGTVRAGIGEKIDGKLTGYYLLSNYEKDELKDSKIGSIDNTLYVYGDSMASLTDTSMIRAKAKIGVTFDLSEIELKVKEEGKWVAAKKWINKCSEGIKKAKENIIGDKAIKIPLNFEPNIPSIELRKGYYSIVSKMGTIYDEMDNPIEGATITIRKKGETVSKKTGRSDKKGFFCLGFFNMDNVTNPSEIPKDTYEVVITKKGFKTKTMEFSAQADTTKYGTLATFLNRAEKIVLEEGAGKVDEGKYLGLDWAYYSDGTLKISGDNSIYAEDYHLFSVAGNYPWDKYCGIPDRYRYNGDVSDVIEIAEENDSEYVIKKVECDVKGAFPVASLFLNYIYLEEVDFGDSTLSGILDCSSMFMHCINLKSVHMPKLDTSKVYRMNKMFDTCESLTELDVSGFDTSNVSCMEGMFAGCKRLTSLDVSGFNTTNVRKDAKKLYRNSEPNDVMANFYDYSDEYCGSMASMFSGCSSLTSLNLSGFDTSKVWDLGGMFDDCSSLTELDVSGFDTSNVTLMYNMFRGCSSLTELDVSHFDTSKVVDMGSMFHGCSSLTELDVNHFDTSKVVDMGGMFYGCSSLTELDVNHFDTSKVTSMGGMFEGCSAISTLDLTNFDTSSVHDMRSMFSECSSLTSLDLSHFDTSNVTSMDYMFYGCSAISTLDLTNFSTTKVCNMGCMFSRCSALEDLKLNKSKFDTSNVSNMYQMFAGCASLKELDLSFFDTRKIVQIAESGEGVYSENGYDEMFYECYNLETLDISSFAFEEGNDWLHRIEVFLSRSYPKTVYVSTNVYNKVMEEVMEELRYQPGQTQEEKMENMMFAHPVVKAIKEK